jgi:hypothetical protein
MKPYSSTQQPAFFLKFANISPKTETKNWNDANEIFANEVILKVFDCQM